MTAEHAAQEHLELVTHVLEGLSTRTLQDFAEEARQDGESLHDAVDRYEIDYAWHVLGSGRLLDETLTSLEARLGQAVSEEQKNCVCDVLKAAAAAQASDLLMSFDNDVVGRLTDRLCAEWGLVTS